jgi:hypothetical protein
MSATMLHAGTAPDASRIAQSAAKQSAAATSRSWCSPFAKKPPAAMPAALPRRYAVRPEAANVSVTPYVRSRIGGAKFCSAPNAITAKRKKKKHIHTTLEPRKSNVPPLGLRASVESSPSRSCERFRCRNASATKPTMEAPIAAVRHPIVSAMPATNTGAAAQPRLPESPCTENAWPRRSVERCG